MQDFSEQGFWWLPDNPERKIAGTMTFDVESGVRLQLIGSLSEHQGFDNLASYPIIHGVVPSKRVSLIECDEASSSVSMPLGVATQTVRVTYAIVGGHVVAEPVFDRMRFELSDLGEFTTISGIEQTIEFEDASGPTRVKIDFDLQTPGVAAELDGVSVELGLSRTFPSRHAHKVNLTEEPFLGVVLPTPTTIEALLKSYVTPLRNLITLAIDRPVDLRSVRVSGPGLPTYPNDKRLFAELLFRPILAPEIPQGTRARVQPLFRLSDLDEVDFEQLVRRWLEIAASLEHAMNLFFGVRYFGGLPLEVQFLETVRATEIYHRVGHPRTAMPPAEFEALVGRIIDCVDEPDREWLGDKLQWANEPSLNARLKDLLALVGDALGSLVTKPSRFRRSVTDSRNYYTHYDAALRAKALRDAELLRAIYVLQLLLRACFLHEVGFSLDRSAVLLGQLPDFRTAQFLGMPEES